ncbi:MAG: hypothetical protein R3C11_19335 [Planctomycetaceae bacterium]
MKIPDSILNLRPFANAFDEDREKHQYDGSACLFSLPLSLG